jgi:predicted PurR-regulated permease PerM
MVAGLLTTVVLLIFGVDFAFTWGALAFLFNYIPYLGSLIATLLPILLALVQFDSWWQAAVIGVVLVGMQEFLGMVVEPKMAGAKLGVSPLLIILSLAFWGVVWGIVGMILAVPLLVAIKIVLDSIPATQPVAKLMGSG